jgi:hypothetical protein
VAPALEDLPDWTAEAIEAELRELSESSGRKLRVMLPPLFVAMSGSPRSLPLFDSMAILGRAMVRQRLKQADQVLKPQPAPEIQHEAKPSGKPSDMSQTPEDPAFPPIRRRCARRNSPTAPDRCRSVSGAFPSHPDQ